MVIIVVIPLLWFRLLISSRLCHNSTRRIKQGGEGCEVGGPSIIRGLLRFLERMRRRRAMPGGKKSTRLPMLPIPSGGRPSLQCRKTRKTSQSPFPTISIRLWQYLANLQVQDVQPLSPTTPIVLKNLIFPTLPALHTFPAI